jgi:PAS domain S-box-containing protein
LKPLKRNIKAIDMARPFEFEELFFSLTDRDSRILFANEVFVRISAYEIEEIDNQLHKVIRHPDMPRSVFKIFWDHLQNNRPVAAYVKNLAKDGKYYWVMALAYPCKNGYMSVRLKPGSKLFNRVKSLYASILEVEIQKEQELGKRKGLNASEEYLLEKLSEWGFESYEEFMWDALKKEMANREGEIDKTRLANELASAHVPADRIQLQATLGQMFARLEKLSELHDVLNEHSSYMIDLAGAILLLSLNAQVGSAKLDESDASLSVIAEQMGEQARLGESELQQVQSVVQKLNRTLQQLNFEIISSKLKVEMANNFLAESGENKSGDNEAQQLHEKDARKILFDSYVPNLKSIIELINQLPGNMQTLKGQVEKIEKFIQVLRLIHTTGKVEIAKMKDDARTFMTTFGDLMSEIQSAQKMLNVLSGIIYDNDSTVEHYVQNKEEIEGVMEQLNA